MAKSASKVFKSIRFAKLDPDHQKAGPFSTDDEEHYTVSTQEYEQQIKHIKKRSMQEDKDPCWTGYEMVGMKKKNGKEVPNCVPEETIKEQKRLYIESIAAVKNKAEKTGMPYSILKQVYDRGMAAWKGGHRPGATQVQWALARVNSFVTKSSGTWGGADSDLAKKVKGD